MECIYQRNCKKYLNNECTLKDSNFCIKKFKLDYLKQLALLSEKQSGYLTLRLDKDRSDYEAFDYLKNVENNIKNAVNEGFNLYIYSTNPGNGKTSWSLRLLNSYIERIWYKSELKCRALFINVPKLLISLKDNISQKNEYVSHIKENILDVDLVVWDDVATKDFTQFEMDNVLNWINNRIDFNKANIYTSNLSGEDLKEAVGERLYSRIYNASKVIEFKGMDKRGLTQYDTTTISQ